MEHIAPLIQTVLWVGLIAGALWRFHGPIYGILVALQKRVESGSNIKAGPFELTEQLKPQDPFKQKEKAATEVQEAFQPPAGEASTPSLPPTMRSRATVQARYFQAEDLVLRTIQAEYGATISRQVTAGADMGFDGAFVSNGRLNIVEVKYVANVGAISRFRMTLEHISSAIARYGWHNVQIILAVVFERGDDVPKASEHLQELAQNLPVPVVVRCYSFAELQVKFGVAGNDSG
jgi:hypothetical protein